MITRETEVLVAGLGPVGAVASLALARQGISVAAIEPLEAGATDLRASTFHAPTLEILHELGASETLFSQGLKAPIWQYRDRQSNEIFTLDLGEIHDRTPYPYRIQCEQHRVTAEILDQLRKQPSATVAHRQRVLFVEQDDSGVTVYVEGPNAVERWRARFLIAADGANSVVRKILGLEFPGFTYNEKFLCFSTAFPIEQGFEQLSLVNYISDAEEWMVLLKVPGLWRILVPADERLPDDQLLSEANKNAVFKRMLGHGEVVQTEHRTIYRVHQRVCERFAVGRVALVGDSAHLNSPMGGFGMNSGIHDAVNVAEKLTRVLREGANATAQLELYERQRQAVTRNFVQAQTIENTRLMRNGWAGARAERRQFMLQLSTDSAARRAYLLKQAMFTSLEEAAAII